MAISEDIKDLEKQKFLDAGNSLPAVRVLDIGSSVEYDYIGVTYPTTSSEVYTYKTGGSGGTTVQTLTVVYTDSTKAVLTSVTKA